MLLTPRPKSTRRYNLPKSSLIPLSLPSQSPYTFPFEKGAYLNRADIQDSLNHGFSFRNVRGELNTKTFRLPCGVNGGKGAYAMCSVTSFPIMKIDGLRIQMESKCRVGAKNKKKVSPSALPHGGSASLQPPPPLAGTGEPSPHGHAMGVPPLPCPILHHLLTLHYSGLLMTRKRRLGGKRPRTPSPTQK